MGAMVLVESCILALMPGAALAQGSSETQTWVHPGEVYTSPSDSGAQATWPVGEAAVGQAQPSTFRRVGLGPFIDMDNRRRDDEDREKRRQEKLRQDAQRDEELRQHYRNYGYTSPPFIYADPRLGSSSRDPRTGRYYNYGTPYYYDPGAGQYYESNKNNNSRRVPSERRGGEVI